MIRVIWHQYGDQSVAHAYRRISPRHMRRMCSGVTIATRKQPVDGGGRCRACLGAIRRYEAEWAKQSAESLRLSEET